MDNPGYEEHDENANGNDIESKGSKNTPNIKEYAIDDAITETGVGIFHYILQLIGGACLTATIIDILGISMAMPFITDELKATVPEQGLVASASFLGCVLSAHGLGVLADTCGRCKVLRITLTISFFTSLLSAFAINIWMLIILRFLTGFMISSSQSSIFNYIGEFHGSSTRTKYITMLSMFVTIGMTVMPAMGLSILPLDIDMTIFGIPFHSWRWFLVANSFSRVIAVIGFFILPETPKFVLMQGDEEKTLKILQMIYSVNKRRPKSEYPVKRLTLDVKGNSFKDAKGLKDILATVWHQTVPLFNKERIWMTLNFAIMLFLVSGIGHSGFVWLPTILKYTIMSVNEGHTICEAMQVAPNTSVSNSTSENEELKFTVDPSIYRIMMVIGVILTVLYFTVSLSINVIGRKKIFVGWSLTIAAACVIMLYVTERYASIAMYVLIISFGNSSGNIIAMAMEVYPANISGMTMSLLMMVSRLGSFTGTNLFALMVYSHCDELFLMEGVFCLYIVLASFFIPKPNTKK